MLNELSYTTPNDNDIFNIVIHDSILDMTRCSVDCEADTVCVKGWALNMMDSEWCIVGKNGYFV